LDSNFSSDQSVEGTPSLEQSYFQTETREIENEIRVGVHKQGPICCLIAAIQIFDHIKEIRTRPLTAADMADQAIHITDRVRRVNTYCHQTNNSTESLNVLNLQLQLSENEDMEETGR
jgi:hypothetical protein